MPDRTQRIDDRRLDLLLAEAAGGVAYPSTPALRGRVVAALGSGAPPARRAPAFTLPAWAYVAVALLALLGAVTLALPGPREAVADFFGFVPGQRIEVLPPSDEAPTATATPTPTRHPPAVVGTWPPTPHPPAVIATPAARRISPVLAETAMGYSPALPSGVGEPDALYVVQYGRQPLLIAVYGDFDLWQTRGAGFFGKGVPSGIVIEQPTVNGRDAFWIEPGGHETAFFDEDGNEVRGSRRTVDSNVLIWRGEETYYRLETERSMTDALAIAAMLP